MKYFYLFQTNEDIKDAAICSLVYHVVAVIQRGMNSSSNICTSMSTCGSVANKWFHDLHEELAGFNFRLNQFLEFLLKFEPTILGQSSVINDEDIMSLLLFVLFVCLKDILGFLRNIKQLESLSNQAGIL